jgi:hypothetical protein
MERRKKEIKIDFNFLFGSKKIQNRILKRFDIDN